MRFHSSSDCTWGIRWLGKNLNVDHFANGDRIPQVQSDEEWKRIAEEKQPAWCYYNNDSVKGYNYGKLYNWYAVHDSRGLAPRGWHIPSDPEWTQLSDHLGGETIAGTKMKSIDLWENDGNGNNNSLFSGLPSGERGAEGTFGYIGVYCGWWSSSESPPEKALLRSLSVGTGRALRVIATKGKGFSVRCIKD